MYLTGQKHSLIQTIISCS